MRYAFLLLALLFFTASVSISDGSSMETPIRIAGVLLAIVCIATYKILDDKDVKKH